MDGTCEGPRVEVERPRCPFCHEAVGADEPKTACEACMAWHHRACWSDHGTCSACGNAAATAPLIVAPRQAAEPPERCRRRGCTAEAERGRFLCARHHVEGPWTALVFGLLATALGLAILQFEPWEGELRWFGIGFAVFGALMLGIALRGGAERMEIWSLQHEPRPPIEKG